MNGFCPLTSAGIQSARFKQVFENGAMRNRRRTNNKENVMLRKFAAALVASALIAGPAFAQSNPAPAAGVPPAAQTTPNTSPTPHTAAKPSMKSGKSAKHTMKHVRKHTARSKAGAATHQARHVKTGKTRHAGVAKTGIKSGKAS